MPSRYPSLTTHADIPALCVRRIVADLPKLSSACLASSAWYLRRYFGVAAIGPDRCVRTKPVFKIYTAVDNPPVEDIVRIECVTVVRLIRCAAHTCPSIGRRAVCPLRLSAKRTFGLEVSTSHAKPFAHSHTQSESNVRSLCGSSHVRLRFGARFGASIRQPARSTATQQLQP